MSSDSSTGDTSNIDSDFSEVLKDLNHLLAGDLVDVRLKSANRASINVKAEKSGAEKKAAVDGQFHYWVEETANIIRKWFPKLVQLGNAYPDSARRDILNWSTEQIRKAIGSLCGVKGAFEYSDWRGRINRPVRWWLAVGCDGDFEADRPDRMEPWSAPAWLRREGRLFANSTGRVIKEYSDRFNLRLSIVILETVKHSRIDRAIDGTRANTGSVTRSGASRKDPIALAFDEFVAPLWNQAVDESPNGRVSKHALKTIAAAVDGKKFDPRKLLPKQMRTTLAQYNQKNAASRRALCSFTALSENKTFQKTIRRRFARAKENMSKVTTLKQR